MSISRSTDRVLPAVLEVRTSSSAARRQILVTFAAGLAGVAVGTCLGWPSPMLDRMSNANWTWPGLGLPLTDLDGDGYPDPAPRTPPRPLTPGEGSWVVSLMDLGIVLGSLPAGWAADRWGRRPVLLGCAPLFGVSWILVIAAQGPELLYAARLLQGLASAIAMIVTAMYAGEVSEDRLRGANSTMVAMLLTLGTVVSYSVGPFVRYRALACTLLTVPALFVLCFCWAPESPYWLLMQGRRLEAELVIKYLRDADASPLLVCAEADRVEAGIVEATAAAAARAPSSSSSSSPGMLSAARELVAVAGPDRRAFCLVMALVSLQALSGSDPMTAYSSVTLPGGFILSSDEVVIFFGVVSTLSTGVGMVLIDRVGRRPLLLLFASLQAVSLLASAVYYSLSTRTDLDLDGVRWVPPGALLLYGVAYPIGLGSVPNALQMELFSTRVKGLALPAILVSFNALTFIVSKLYEVVWHAWGKDVTFWFFSADCILAVLVTAIFLKETKGRSFQEIQDLLDPRRKLRVSTWPS